MPSNEMDRPAIIASALAVSAIGALFYNILPLYLGVAQDFRSLDNRAIGFISSAFFLGFNIATLSAFFWIRKIDWRVIAWTALPTAVVAILLATLTPTFGLLLVFTAVAGGAFATLYGLGTTIIGDTSNPARWYGAKIAGEAIPGVALLFILPGTLVASRGMPGLGIGLIACILLLSPLLFGLPRGGQEPATGADAAEAGGTIETGAIWVCLAGIAVFFSGSSAMWAFSERIGNAIGIEASVLGNLLAVTLATAVLGSVAAAWMGERFGNTRPFITAVVLFLCALLLISSAGDAVSFGAGASLLTFAIGLGLPFSVAEAARLDTDGRYVVLTVPAIGFGAMLGPGIAGLLSQAWGYQAVLGLGASAVITAMLLLSMAGRRGHYAR